MKLPLGIHVGERLSLDQTYWQAEFADSHGFESVWVAEGRLARDGIVPAAIIASRTNHVKIGTAVVNNKSRNAALMAVTFKTLDEVAPGRTILGIGAWWEPLATKVGQPLHKPITSMREYITVCQAFFRNEVVNFEGEFVQMHEVRFDSMYRENNPVDVPIYIGAVGPKMLELAGEISDGVVMDFLLPVSYLHDVAKPAINAGVARQTDGHGKIDLTQMVSCSVNDKDPQEAINACKAFLTLYLMQQPHIGAHSGVERELVERIQQVAGWPATPDDIKRAMPLLSNSLVQNVTACGSTDEAYSKLVEYHEAGVRCPLISTLGDKEQTLTRLADAAAGI